ncbi:MAG: translocation/assembly module TamB domain-containing protein, partial [Acidobacteria bacterium]|nr:translocation/assembly module TamB domain-containing protein [Acidobacteriota bacterium]
MEPTESGQPPHGRHTSARERQRRGPMWGCLKALFWIFTVSLLVLLIVVGGGWWYLGTGSFAGLVKSRIEATLKAKLGREVTIHDVVFVRSRPTRIILNDIRIANAPNGKAKYFATVRQVEITGGVESFWGRKIQVGRIDIRDPHLNFEVYPNGEHNFPRWQSGPSTGREIVHLELGQMFVTGGAFSFDDIKHQIAIVTENLGSQIQITSAQNMYEGVATSPRVHVRIQDYEPFDVDLRGGFRFTPGVLQLNSVALKGQGIEAFVSGKLDPLADGVYNLRVSSRVGLEKIADIFRIDKTLLGTIALDGNLHGKQGEFALTGSWAAPKIVADAYELTNARGKMNVTGEKTALDVDTARYGGGTLSAHYDLPGYSEPYPMSVDLRLNNVSIEKLFGDWGMTGTGLRGGATGSLKYAWNKDKLLDGNGSGHVTLAKNATAFSNAKYPIPLAGSTDLALDKGTIRFSNGTLNTDASTINFSGSMRIEDLNSDLALRIHSNDFAELDRIAYNFAHAADKNDFELLGFGGAGDITGTVKGTLKEPTVVAHVASTATKYNNVLLGDADIDLRYDGKKSVLQFDKATFRNGNERLALNGTIAFPERGPSPRFDLAVDAVDYPVERALQIVNLTTLKLRGNATGRMLVAGTPEAGRVTFVNTTVRQGETAYVKLNGTTNWAPGDGNVSFNLDVAANEFPVEDIAAFLDFANIPVKGQLTGTLHLEGSKASLEGAGAIVVRNGSIMGEPVTEVRADIAFTKGTLKTTNVTVTAPAGTITGEAEIDLNTKRFSYNVNSSSIDLSKIGLLASLQSMFGGKLVFTSTGAGTFDQPELMIEAKLNDATLQGLNLPPNAAPPSIYLAIRNGQLIIRGAIADVVTIEGNGTVGPDMTVDGTVRLTISDVAKALALSPSTASLPAAGNAVVDLKLSGKLTPIEALVIEGSVPTLNLTVAGNPISAPRPLQFSLRNGRATFDDFTLAREDSAFTVSGYADIIGDKKIDIGLKGGFDAPLLQIFMRDLRANGRINITAGVTGTLSSPRINGTAELQDAQFKFAGFPQLIDHVNGTLVFKGDRIDIDSLRATVGGGEVVAGGFITVNGIVPERVRISLQGTDVALRYYEGLTVAGDFNILISGDLERASVTGDVNVTRALYFKDFDLQTSLVNVLLSRRGVQPVVSASWQDRVDLRVHVVAPQTLAVRNNIASVTGSAELDVTGTLSNPVVLGLVTLDEGGRVRIQGVDYQVVRGSINFQNPFRIDPYFDVTIEGRVSSTGGGLSSELEGGPVDVTINLNGTIDRFTPSITSEPPASDITLFSLLGFGGITQGSDRYGEAAPNAALAGRSLLYQSLFSAIGQKILPFADSFTYDPGLLDTTGDQRPKVTFEKRLSSKLALLVVYSIGDGKTRQVLEWAINPEWTLLTTRDEIRTREFRVEARFRRRYDGQWTFGGRGKNPLAMFAALRPAEDQNVQTSAGPAGEPALRSTQPTPIPSNVMPVAGSAVTGINFVADATFNTETLGQYVALKVGEPMSIRAEQSTLKALFATGDFRDIRIDAVPDGNGVSVTIRLFLNYRVGRIHFDGVHGSDKGRAERELEVHVGDVLSLNAVERSAAAIQQALFRNGYLEASVDYETKFERPRSLADVEFFVNTGTRAKIGTVEFVGDTKPFTQQDLIARMSRGPGKSFVLADARTDARNMRVFMLRREYRKADVDYLGYTYDKEAKTVTLRYQVSVGPIVKVEVEGVSRGSVRSVLPFSRNQAYSEDAVDRAADEILALYQQRGYYNVAVDTEGRLVDPNTWVTTFHVDPGQQFKLTAVTFSGNARISDKELAGIVATAPKGGFSSLIGTIFRRPSGITRSQLSADRDAIESY